MRTRLLSLLLVITAVSASACDKPKQGDCQKAVENINKIYKINVEPAQVAAAVRKCQASSSKASVDCMIAATDDKQADACKGKK